MAYVILILILTFGHKRAIIRTMASLLDYTNDLQSKGRLAFTRDEALKTLGMSEEAFRKAASRLQNRHLLSSPRPGFYVAVPPQYLAWQAPPPSWYIDDLMRHEGRDYYVGLLKAAELFGATHQAVMEFQVITDKQIPKIHAGRSLIVFYYRKDLERVLVGREHIKTDTGTMCASKPQLTALDLVRYPQATGGMDATATILKDLAERIDARALARLSQAFERTVVQRVGYLLDWLGHEKKAQAMHAQ